MLFVPTCTPMKRTRTTNANHATVAVFQWPALQRPMRAARFFECSSGVMSCSFSALRLRVGRIREGMVEGRKRVRACDVELELLVLPCVGDRDLHAICRLAPEERDLEAFVRAACELCPVDLAGGELEACGCEMRGAHDYLRLD